MTDAAAPLPPLPATGRRTPWQPLVRIALWAFALRALNLWIGRTWSLWLDEGATWSWAVRPTWGGTVFAEANHPPGWWVVTRLWIGAFGDSEASLRTPAALLGLLSVWLAWRVGLRLLDPAHAPSRGGFPRADDHGRGARLALWFAGAVGTAAYFLEYAQEARMYAALLAVSLGLSLLYLRWLDRGDRASLVGYATLAAVGLHTHYFAVWPVIAHAAHALWLWRRGRRGGAPLNPLPFLVACTVAGLLFVPWFLYLVGHYEGIAHKPREPLSLLLYVLWRVGAGPGLVIVDRERQVEGWAAVAREEWPVVLVTAVLWFVPLVLGAWALRRRPGLRAFLVAGVLVPVALLLAVYFRFALIHERYVVFLAPWLFLLALLGADAARGWARHLLFGGLLLLVGVGVAAYHFADDRLVPVGRGPTLDGEATPRSFAPEAEGPFGFLHHGHPYGREPWREAWRFVELHARPGDAVLLHPDYVDLVWRYYARAGDLDTFLLPRTALDADAVRARWGADLEGRRRVFLVLAHEETPDEDHYFGVLRTVLQGLWARGDAWRFQAIGPILFNLSWGVRVAVFSRD